MKDLLYSNRYLISALSLFCFFVLFFFFSIFIVIIFLNLVLKCLYLCCKYNNMSDSNSFSSLVLFVGLFVCFSAMFYCFLLFFIFFGFKMFVLVLQIQSQINKTYQTHIRFNWGICFQICLWSGALISKVSIRKNDANYTWFHL